MRMKRRMKGLGLTCLALICAIPVLAATANPAPPQSFEAAIDVRVVNVEAVVMDGRGRRVEGLDAVDFRLLVDGREVPIDYFTEVKDGEVVAGRTASGAPAPAASASPGEEVGTNYLVFIDELFSIASPRDIVLKRLIKDLSRLGPADRMAVLAFNGQEITRLSDWTNDREALAGTFRTAMARPSLGIARLAERRSEGMIVGDLAGIGALYPLIADIENAVAAISATMRATTVPPGRKVLLLLSGGMAAPEGITGNGQRGAFGIYDVPRDEELFAPIIETANLLGFTLYTVDVQGHDPETSSLDVQSMEPIRHDFITSSWERGADYALELLAQRTGGKAVINSARLNALERVTADTRSYYWLGFTPQWRADGTKHDIRLEVRKGLSVRARTGFSDLTREAEAQLETESRLLFGGGTSAEAMRAQAGEPRRAGLFKMELPVALEIPASALTPLPADGGWQVEATLSVTPLDEGVGNAEWQTLPIRLTLAELPAPGAFTHYETTLKLPRASKRVVIAVSDDRGTGKAWTAMEVRP